MTLEVRREWIALLAALSLLGAVLLLGWQASPSDAAGRPILLLPEVRAVERYRRQTVTWIQAWQALDDRLTASLNSGEADLLAKSQAARSDLDAALQLAQRVAGTEPPATLVGLHEQTTAIAQAFANACLTANRWIATPSPANRATAQTAHTQAHTALVELEANAWVKTEPTAGN